MMMMKRVLQVEIFEEFDGEISCLMTEDKLYSTEMRLKIVEAAAVFEAAVKKAVGKELAYVKTE